MFIAAPLEVSYLATPDFPRPPDLPEYMRGDGNPVMALRAASLPELQELAGDLPILRFHEGRLVRWSGQSFEPIDIADICF